MKTNIKTCGLGALMALVAMNTYGADVRVNATLDRAKLQADGKDRAVVRIRVEPELIASDAERPPVNIALVIDRSGSMQGEKLRQAKAGAIEALSRLNAKDIVSVVSYESRARVVVPAQHVDNVTRIARMIEGIEAGGNTALHAGVKLGAKEIRKNAGDEYFHRLILLSDGLANHGPSSVGDLKSLGGELSGRGISVSTIGVGLGFNEDLMTGLAESGEGNTYFVESSDDLPKIFAAEVGDVLNLVAKNLIITIQCGDGVKPIKLIGRKGDISARSAKLKINQLYGGLNKDVLLEVEVDGRDPAEEAEIVLVDVSYEDAADGSAQSRQAAAKAQFSRDKSEIAASVDAEVLRVVVDNQIAEAKEDAIRLMDAGKKTEAVGRLRSLKSSVLTANSVVNDDYVDRQAEVLEAEAKDLDSNGMGNVKRKAYRTDSYQTKTQQKVVR